MTLPGKGQAGSMLNREGVFSSPTESEFSEGCDGFDSVRLWDEKKVADWLHSIRCGQYEAIFKANHFNGDNLLDCDQKILQEMGIKKVGDRVRISVAVKQLRTKSVSSRKKKNRDSFVALDSSRFTPPSAESPRPSTARQQPSNSRQWPRHENGKGSPRAASPLTEHDRGLRPYRYAGASPVESARREQGGSYFSRPSDPSQSSRAAAHMRQAPSIDGLTMGALPPNSPVIRVIYTGGQTKVLNVKHCKTAEEVMLAVLRKLLLPESHFRNYCFYVLDGLDPDPANCRRISDSELLQICDGSGRSERGRLILRKLHAGEPEAEELQRAAQLAMDENQVAHMNALSTTNGPIYPKIATAKSRMIVMQSPKFRSFFGARPPSEMIIHELTSSFPSHQKEDIEKTMRLSVRRSQRLSRAASRLSVVSNISLASSLKDAPPIPSIADTWLTGAGQQPTRGSRPLSVSRFNLPQASFRDSIASSNLQPLQEESPVEPNRKSYVSFDSASEIAGGESRQGFLDESICLNAPDTGGSLNERLSIIVAEDVELPSATKGTEFDNKKTTMVNALKHEISLLQGLQHPNIVQYLGTSTDDQYLNIFLEYVPGGSIATMLKQYNTFQEPLIRNFVRQILTGLSYLHSRDIIHRDIKGANVLVDNKGQIKISDFGISKRVEASNMLSAGGSARHLHRPSLQGSVYWMAPEVVRQTAHTKKADIWSLGCLVVEMFIGAHPFPDCSQLQAIFAIGNNKARPPPPENASKEATAFLDMTFEIDHEKRPSADDLLNDPFLETMIG
ncbi:kinase byr2 [Coccidioides immitis H538.4]|uniref:mitogen-activated protein kinase kinase kinase n=1 Tax=Coccidioides immitis H538.4 TaxID=396776 RepID=A0A0J8S0R6_COCIT|nr:kinase byr2 [Coccidioides immitis H538.4]